MKIEKPVNMIIWKKEFSLPIIYECYDGEVVTEQQIEAINNFIAHKEWVENSKIKVEEYCKKDVMADYDNDTKDNIFSYLKPDHLFVERYGTNVRVALMCDYNYNDDGVAVVFASDGSVTVGSQDIIL